MRDRRQERGACEGERGERGGEGGERGGGEGGRGGGEGGGRGGERGGSVKIQCTCLMRDEKEERKEQARKQTKR